ASALHPACPASTGSLLRLRSGPPFDSSRNMMCPVPLAEGDKYIQYTKGAPDEVLKRCTAYWDGAKAQPMTDAKRQEILAANKAMADKALRVQIGRAHSELQSRFDLVCRLLLDKKKIH